MSKSWKNDNFKKHGKLWEKNSGYVREKKDFGQNVLEPAGTWKNPISYGPISHQEDDTCELYLATRIATGQREIIIEGFKTPKEERKTVPINIEFFGRNFFTGIYHTIGEKEVKAAIPLGKLSDQDFKHIVRILKSMSSLEQEAIVDVFNEQNPGLKR